MRRSSSSACHWLSHSCRSSPGSYMAGSCAGGGDFKRAISYDRPVRALVVGSGGREHALAWSLSRSGDLDELHAAPGNPGVAALAHCHPVRADDHAALVSLARELRIDLVVVGPEAPLVAGLADELRHRGIAVFGPSAAAAQIEGSKAFAKEVMETAGVPTARTLPVARPPCVLKLDGLAAGKGVWVCRTQDELDSALEVAQAFDQPFHAEELLEGPELSVFALAAGETAVAFPPARDYKRIGDGDTGPNTGGMGSFSPLPDVADEHSAEILGTVHVPVLRELARRGSPIQGIEAAEATGALVFHAGTALHDGQLVTKGGRILNVVGTGATVAEARSTAYEAAAHIDFAGMHLRTDIAANV